MKFHTAHFAVIFLVSCSHLKNGAFVDVEKGFPTYQAMGKSSWRFCLSRSYDTWFRIFVSSANFTIKLLSPTSMSPTYIMNSMNPKIESCDTPLVIGAQRGRSINNERERERKKNKRKDANKTNGEIKKRINGQRVVEGICSITEPFLTHLLLTHVGREEEG